MNWLEQTNQLLSSWTEAQKQMMGGWSGILQGMPWAGGSTNPFDPMQMLRVGVDTWSGLTGGAQNRVAGNLLGTPDVMVRSVNLLMKAWQAVAPQMEAGKPWQPDLKKVLDLWRDELTAAPARQVATMNEFAGLTKTLLEQWTPITAPWLAMVGQALGSGHPGAAFLGSTQGMNRMMGFEEGVMPILTGLGELPRGTVVREKMGTILKAVDSLTDLRQAQARFHAAMGEAIARAVERTIEHLGKLAEQGEKITSVRDLMRTWFTIADKTLNEQFMTDEFQELQNGMTAALMTHKVHQREALELIYSAMELPTRTEVDEAYRDIHDLKKEVRKLKRQVQELSQPAAVKSTRKPAAKPVAAAES